MDIKLTEILMELRSESMQVNIQPSEEKLRTLMHKYDMMFVGEKFNHIYSMELCHALKNHFGIEIDNKELTDLIPTVCTSLNMKHEPLIEANKIGKSTEPGGYKIILW